MRVSYLDYAMSIIIGSMPDVGRTQACARRVLFAMHDLKNNKQLTRVSPYRG